MTYGELDINEERRVQWAFKGKREHIVKVNIPNVGHPQQQIDIEIPTGSQEHVIVPNSVKVTFNLKLESTKKGRSIVKNVGRALVTKKVLSLGSKDLETVNNSCIFDTYKDLYLPKHEREDRFLQGIQGAQGLKARVGATKEDGGALAFTDEENAIQKTLESRFSIPLDFDFFNQPVYPYGLEEKLVARLTLNSAENIILVTGDSNATYTISDIALEYDCIVDGAYGDTMYETYRNGTSIPYNKVTCVYYQKLDKTQSIWKLDINGVNSRSLRGVLMVFVDDAKARKAFECKNEQFYNPTIKKVLVTVNGLPHQLYPGGFLSRDLFPEIQKYFQTSNSAVTLGEYCTSKFACWIDMRSSVDNKLHGSGRSVDRGLLFQVEKVAEASGDLTCYVFSIGDAVAHVKENKLVSIEG